MISAKDATLRYVFMNRIHAEVHSVSADESVGRTETEIRGPEAAGVEALDQEVIESGQPCPFREEPHRNGQGIVESWLTTRVPIKSADGRPSAVVTIGVNITERKRLEEELRQAQKMESVGRLAGGVAHDFNNLLTVITGRAELLLGRLGPDSPPRRELELIRDAGERGAALTQQLLAFSRKQVLQPSVLDLNAVLADLEPMLRRLLHETIDLVVGPGAARATVRADRGQLEQVVFNLVINAQDAM